MARPWVNSTKKLLLQKMVEIAVRMGRDAKKKAKNRKVGQPARAVPFVPRPLCA